MRSGSTDSDFKICTVSSDEFEQFAQQSKEKEENSDLKQVIIKQGRVDRNNQSTSHMGVCFIEFLTDADA